MKRIGDIAVGAVLLLPILAVGLVTIAHDLWLMNRVRWARRRGP